MDCIVCYGEATRTIDGDHLCDSHADDVERENERAERDSDAAWESMRDYD